VKHTKRIPYLHRRSDAAGWYFVRRVPADLREQVGHTYWRYLLAHDLATARLRLPEALANTERLIQSLRDGGGNIPVSVTPPDLIRRQLQGLPAAEVFHHPRFYGTPSEAIELSELPPEPSTTPVSSDDLISLGIRLKTPSEQTQLAWQAVLKTLVKFIGHDRLDMLERSDAQEFRDHMLTSLKVSTIKTRLGFITGLFQLGVEEGLLSGNPFTGVGKRLKTEPKTSHDLSIDQVLATDKAALERLTNPQLQVYYILRLTGMRLAEAAGLMAQDIDLGQGLIHVLPNGLRPLKTKDSRRVVPIHQDLMPILTALVVTVSGQIRRVENDLKTAEAVVTQIRHAENELSGAEAYLFPTLYNPDTHRWGGGITWSRLIGINPHGLRHNAVSMMRQAGINETIISRVVGHSASNMTASYGTVVPELLRQAIDTITPLNP
jgi:integrase